jgi:hypothetical protein
LKIPEIVDEHTKVFLNDAARFAKCYRKNVLCPGKSKMLNGFSMYLYSLSQHPLGIMGWWLETQGSHLGFLDCCGAHTPALCSNIRQAFTLCEKTWSSSL